MREGDTIIRIVDDYEFYVKDADGNVFCIDVFPYVNGAGNIIINYERTKQ